VTAAPGISRGLFTRFEDGHQQIVFSASGVRAMRGPFFSERAAWVLVQTHELGHVLGVPASSDHTWHDGHCTEPRCVMYPKTDWRSVMAGILALGPPRGFCAKCEAELRSARAGQLASSRESR
jgi:predicted Zn-dependent protease